MKTILITGASIGLGLTLTKKLRNLNYHLILTARSESLHRFKEAGITEDHKTWIRPLDVLIPEQREILFQEIHKKFKSLDILINNAGFAYRSVLEHVEQKDLLTQMITNFWGPMELVRLALPKMREQKSGHIINISSVGGMMAMPTMSVYSASKFALEGASESLYYEVKPWNIHVSLVEPGFINSKSFQNVKYTSLSQESMRTPSAAYFGHYYFMTKFIEKVMRHSLGTTDSVANKIIKLINSKNPALRTAATPDAFFFDFIRRFLPRKIYHWLLYYNLPFPDCWGDDNRLAKRCQIPLEQNSI